MRVECERTACSGLAAPRVYAVGCPSISPRRSSPDAILEF